MRPTPKRIQAVNVDDLITPAGLSAPDSAKAGVVRKCRIPKKVTSASYAYLRVAWFKDEHPHRESLIEVKTHHVNVSTGYLFVMCNLKDTRSRALYNRLFTSVSIVDLNGGDDDSDGDEDKDGPTTEETDA